MVSPSNMEIGIGTHHLHSSTSQKEEEEEEEEVKRNWLALPDEVMSLIFMKLGHVDIFLTVQNVCTSWWKFSKQPHLFRSILVEKVFTLFGHSFPWNGNSKFLRKMARQAIDRSCGQLVEFSVQDIANDELLHYMSEKSSSLRCLRLVCCHKVNADGWIEMAKKLPQLEELEIIQSLHFSKDVIKTFGHVCPRLKSCQLNYLRYYPIGNELDLDRVALTIAENMPELRHLKLFARNVIDEDLLAILDGCPHLESLDLRQCFDLKFAGDLKERCGNIKVLRLPNDPIDDFEYQLQRDYGLYDSESSNDEHEHFGMDSDDEVYGNDFYVGDSCMD